VVHFWSTISVIPPSLWGLLSDSFSLHLAPIGACSFLTIRAQHPPPDFFFLAALASSWGIEGDVYAASPTLIAIRLFLISPSGVLRILLSSTMANGRRPLPIACWAGRVKSEKKRREKYK